jgi:hypothetical protein
MITAANRKRAPHRWPVGHRVHPLLRSAPTSDNTCQSQRAATRVPACKIDDWAVVGPLDVEKY